MVSKGELAHRILSGMEQLQNRPATPHSWRGRLPELIPTGDGRSILISEEVSQDIGRFARLVHANDRGLPASVASRDMEALIRQAFGNTLAGIDFADEPDGNREKLLAGVRSFLQEKLLAVQEDKGIVFGCWLIRDVPIDVQIGPVRIEPRSGWLTRMRSERRISSTTERRLRRHWTTGERLHARRTSYDAMWERDLLTSIGGCPDACTVETRGLSSNLAEQKGILVARLASPPLRCCGSALPKHWRDSASCSTAVGAADIMSCLDQTAGAAVRAVRRKCLERHGWCQRNGSRLGRTTLGSSAPWGRCSTPILLRQILLRGHTPLVRCSTRSGGSTKLAKQKCL